MNPLDKSRLGRLISNAPWDYETSARSMPEWRKGKNQVEFINEHLQQYAREDLAGAKQLWADHAPANVPQPAFLERPTLAERLARADFWYAFHGDPVKERKGRREAQIIGKELKELAATNLPAAQKLWRQYAPKEFPEPEYLRDQVDLPTRLEVDAMLLEHDAHKMLDQAAEKYDQARALRDAEDAPRIAEVNAQRERTALEAKAASGQLWIEEYEGYHTHEVIEPEREREFDEQHYE